MTGLALVIALLIAQETSATSSRQGVLEVLKTRHVATSVRINGKDPVRLVFDTGSPITFVRAGAARRIGLIDDKTARGFSLGGLRTMVKAKSVEAGGAEVKDLNVVILDHPTIELIGRFTGGVDGILGFSFFSRFRTVIDYVAETISFTPNDYVPEEVFGSVMRRVFLGLPDEKVIAPSGLWGMAIDNAPGGKGVLVKEVFPGTPADSAGLRAGDRILTIDDRWTNGVQECYQAAAGVPAGESVVLAVERGHDQLNLNVTPVKGI